MGFCAPQKSSSGQSGYDSPMNHRRSFLRKSVAVASALSMPALARAAVAAPHERILRFHNTHTGESLKSVFWAEGQFIPEALQDINTLLRDHRSNTIATIDPDLLLLVEKVSAQFGSNNIVHIISAYRSPESNRKLAEASGGVAKHSMHMEGKAIDLRIPRVDLKQVHKYALGLKGGGVGYYQDSQFVHMDTGRVRHW
jgi:uncharacterized protein YcbK (DUF882 family)